MKTRLIVLLLIVAAACSKTSDPSPGGNNSTTNVATIDGKAFSASDTKVTDTGAGLELRLKDASTDISLRLSDKTAGTYTIDKTSLGGRLQATFTAVVQFTTGGTTYFGQSGTVTVVIDASGKVSATFTVVGKSIAGATSSITAGAIASVAVTQPAATQCLITKIESVESSSSGTYTITETFAYDSDGKLIQSTQVDDYGKSVANYFWSNGHIAWSQRLEDGSTTVTAWTYQSDLLTKMVSSHSSSNGTSTETSTLSYTGSQLTNFNTYSIKYSGGNVTSVTPLTGYTGLSINYSNYDSNKNPALLFAAAENNPAFYAEGGAAIEENAAELISVNNVGKEVWTYGTSTGTTTYTYSNYNAKGYPTQVKSVVADTSGSTTTTYTVNTTITYSGCN